MRVNNRLVGGGGGAQYACAPLVKKTNTRLFRLRVLNSPMDGQRGQNQSAWYPVNVQKKSLNQKRLSTCCGHNDYKKPTVLWFTLHVPCFANCRGKWVRKRVNALDKEINEQYGADRINWHTCKKMRQLKVTRKTDYKFKWSGGNVLAGQLKRVSPERGLKTLVSEYTEQVFRLFSTPV